MNHQLPPPIRRAHAFHLLQSRNPLIFASQPHPASDRPASMCPSSTSSSSSSTCNRPRHNSSTEHSFKGRDSLRSRHNPRQRPLLSPRAPREQPLLREDRVDRVLHFRAPLHQRAALMHQPCFCLLCCGEGMCTVGNRFIADIDASFKASSRSDLPLHLRPARQPRAKDWR